ncbi:hypothetical protein NMY22_g9554 [Coprinellus aureogranulatus]|nr:hypothetical protein NMY22_g9554 [Coprinellus aureogranulatus]
MLQAVGGPTTSGPSFFSGGQAQSLEGTDISHVNGNMYSTKITVNCPVLPGPTRTTFAGSGIEPGGASAAARRPPLSIKTREPQDGSLQRIARIFSGHSKEETCKLSSVADFYKSAVDSHELSNAEIYVRGLSLASDKGLPCWQPKPSALSKASGVQPGDVGIFTAGDGFNKIFNLWDDEDAIRNTQTGFSGSDDTPPDLYHAPKCGIVRSENSLDAGDAISHGVHSDPTVHLRPDGSWRTSAFSFTCHSQQGAMLAVTSPVSLTEATHLMSIQECIMKYAEHLYRYAECTMGVQPDKSLYVITSCMKSDSWALAAYRDLPSSVDERLVRLVHIGDTEIISRASGRREQIPVYDWKERGPTEAKGSAYTEGRQVENQTLFLRGFNITFSRKFVEKLRKEPTLGYSYSGTPSEFSEDTLRSTSDCDSGIEENGWHMSGDADSRFEHYSPFTPMEDRHGEDDHARTGRQSMGSRGYESMHEVERGCSVEFCDEITLHSDPSEIDFEGGRVDGFPTDRAELYDPCEVINSMLLNETGAEVAISHDDDWRFAFGKCNRATWHEEVRIATPVRSGLPPTAFRRTECSSSRAPTSGQNEGVRNGNDVSRPTPRVKETVSTACSNSKIFGSPAQGAEETGADFRTSTNGQPYGPQGAPHPPQNLLFRLRNMTHKLFGTVADLEYHDQEIPSQPPASRYSAICSVVPLPRGTGFPMHLGFGSGPTVGEARSNAAEEGEYATSKSGPPLAVAPVKKDNGWSHLSHTLTEPTAGQRKELTFPHYLLPAEQIQPHDGSSQHNPTPDSREQVCLDVGVGGNPMITAFDYSQSILHKPEDRNLPLSGHSVSTRLDQPP